MIIPEFQVLFVVIVTPQIEKDFQIVISRSIEFIASIASSPGQRDIRNFAVMTLAVDFYPLPEGYCFTSDTPLTLTAPPPPLHPQPLKAYCQSPYGGIPVSRSKNPIGSYQPTKSNGIPGCGPTFGSLVSEFDGTYR